MSPTSRGVLVGAAGLAAGAALAVGAFVSRPEPPPSVNASPPVAVEQPIAPPAITTPRAIELPPRDLCAIERARAAESEHRDALELAYWRNLHASGVTHRGEPVASTDIKGVEP